MSKKLNMVALIILLMGQVILGPMGTGVAWASEDLSAQDNSSGGNGADGGTGTDDGIGIGKDAGTDVGIGTGEDAGTGDGIGTGEDAGTGDGTGTGEGDETENGETPDATNRGVQEGEQCSDEGVSAVEEEVDCTDVGLGLDIMPFGVAGVPGSIKVTTLDEDGVLIKNNPATFILTDKNGEPLSESQQTSNDGVTVFTDLENYPPTSYYLVELVAPVGYKINPDNTGASDKNKYTMDILVWNPGDKFAEVKHEKIPQDAECDGPGKSECRDVTVTKVNPKGEKIPGITFNISHPNGKNAKTAITDENGVATFHNVHNGKTFLSEGENKGYEFCSASDSYGKTYSTPKIEFENNRDHSFTFVNAKIGECELTNEKPALGVTKIFEGAEDKDDDLEADFDLIGGDAYGQDNLYKSLDQDVEHMETIYFKNLPDGKYTLTETDTEDDEGYVLIAPQQFEVKNGEIINVSLESYNEETKIVTITNKKITNTSNVILTKVDKDNPSTTLPNAKFKLWKYEKSKGWKEQPGTYTTDENGQIKEKLAEGTYKFKEITAPDNYEIIGDGYTKEFIVGKKGETTFTVENKQVKANVILTKVDKDNPSTTLPNAKFKLWKYEKYKGWKEQTETYTTDENGQIKEKLTEGTYKFKEIAAPDNYEIIGDGYTKEFTVGKKGETTLTVENKPNHEEPKGKIVITKVDPKLPSFLYGDRLNGAKFALYHPDDLENPIATETTDGILQNTGTATFDNLEYGTYVLKEIKAPYGYMEDNLYEETIIIDSNVAVKRTITNEKRTIVTLTKYEEGTDIPLKGAEFKLQYCLLWCEDVPGQKNLVTDVNGQIQIDYLPLNGGTIFGNYKFVETKAPEGYAIGDVKEYPFSVALGTTEIIKVTAYNTLTTSVTLTKHNEENSNTPKTLPGASFELFKENEDGSQGVQIPGLWKTAGDAGQFTIDNLPIGKYQFVEKDAPDGYEKDDNPISFEITEENVNTTVDAYNATLTGSQKLFKFTYESEDVKKGLNDVEFSVYRVGEPDELVEPGLKTKTKMIDGEDKDGYLVVENLPYGEYYFQETKEPEGYMKVGTPYYFTVDGNTVNDKVVEVENKLAKGSITFMKRAEGSESELGITGAKFTLMYNATEAANYAPLGIDYVDDGTGYFHIEGLAYGYYQLVEASAPEFYVKDATPFEFVINEEISNPDIPDIYNEKGGDIVVEKVDAANAEKLLDGATFELYKQGEEPGSTLGDPIGTATTGANGEKGIAIFKGVPYGNYTIKEIDAPDGYMASTESEAGIAVELVVGEDQAFKTVTNVKTHESFKIIKKDAADDTLLPNAVFKLQVQNAETDLYDDVEGMDNIVTGPTGESDEILLPPGSYQLVEMVAPEGYVGIGTTVTFTIEKNQIKVKVITIQNDKEETGGNPDPRGVTLHKIASNTELGLNNAVFSLFKEIDGKYVEYRTGLTTSDKDGLGNGYLVVSDLEFGNYYFVETNAPSGYTKNTDHHEFTVSEDSIEPEMITVVNEPVRTPPGPNPNPEPETETGTITLVKQDSETKTALSGAIFSLFRAGDSTAYRTGLTTGADGYLVVEDLPVGNYYFVETKAPDNYQLGQTEYTFAISEGQSEQVPIVVGNTKIVVPEPDPETGSATLTKTDSEDGAALGGAVFSLFKVGEEVAYATGLTTNSEGILSVEDLPIGDYYFVETQAPSGYLVNATPLTITVNVDQNTGVGMTNTKIPQIAHSITLLKTDSVTDLAINGAEFAIFSEIAGDYVEYRTGLITGAGQDEGRLLVGDLPIGQYYIIETAAPDGYDLGDNPPRIAFEITSEMEATLDLGTVENTPTSTGGGGGGSGGGGGGGGTTVPETPQPEGPSVTVPETPQPEGPNITVPETPQPEGPNVTVPEMPQPEGPSVAVPEEPQPEGPKLVSETPSVTVTEQPRPEAPKVPPVVSRTLPKTGEEVPVKSLISGLTLAILGGWLLFGRRKRRDSQL